MFKISLALSLLASVVMSTCNNGCLYCDTDTNTCLFCDILNNYKLSSGSCSLTSIGNCQMIDINGNCLLCDQDYYLNTGTSTCDSVPALNLITNCIYYSSSMGCLVCDTNYYLSSGACVAVTTPITDCEVNDSDTECSKCASGFVTSFDRTSCVAVAVSNCHGYSYVKCRTCDTGYIKNANYYIDLIYGYSNTLAYWMLTNKLYASETDRPDTNNYDVCHLKNVSNCSVFSTGNKCDNCASGYYVNSNYECTANPIDDLQGCMIYSSLTSCTKCDNGYKLTGSNICTTVTAISDCATYNGAVTTDTCLACSSNYYLLSNTCQARSTLTVANCDSLKSDDEGCKTCSDGYTATSDALACLTSKNKCSTYATSDLNTTVHTCTACEDLYYLDTSSGSCTPGSVSNCKQYQTTSNTCAICNNSYYLDSGACSAHDSLSGCVTYSNSTKNTCTACNGQSYLFTRSNTCAAVTPINNCKTYATTTTCSQCNNGYYLQDSTTCSQIPTGEHCLQKNAGGNCILCESTYVLESGACKTPIDNIRANCQNSNLDGLINYSQQKCNYCSANSVPVNYKDTYVCFRNTYLQNQLSITLVSDCLQYYLDGANYICKRCTDDKYLSSGSCVSTCGTTLYSHMVVLTDNDGNSTNDSYFIDTVNDCNTDIPNCSIATPDIYQLNLSSVSYACVECTTGKTPIVSFDNPITVYRPASSILGSATLTPVSFSLPLTCSNDAALGNVKGELNGTGFINNCDKYYDISVGKGCLKCDHGYTGIVIDAIHNCSVYSDILVCSKCNDGYYLKNSTTCLIVDAPIANCQSYSPTASTIQCIECNTNYYLTNSTTCTSRSNVDANCAVYFVSSDACQTCDTNYFLDGLTCIAKLSFCSTHQVNPALTCLGCDDGYYLYSGSCIAGSVTDCTKYLQTGVANQCSACINGKFPNSNVCTNHVTVPNCDKYDQSRNKCLTCTATHFLFSQNNKCASVTPITHCIKYNTLTTCKRCDIGYYVGNAAQVCNTIPASWYCTEFGDYRASDNNGCITCEIGNINISGLCYNWFNFIKTNCDTTFGITETGRETKRVCSYCADNAEPETFTTEYVCLEKTMIDYWITNEATTGVFNNCKRYIYDINTIKCIECDPGYVIYPANFKCIQESACNNNIITIDFNITNASSKKALITTTAGPTCTNLSSTRKHPLDKKCYYSPSTNTKLDDDVVYYCSKCFGGYVPVVDLTSGAMVVTEGIAEMNNPLETYIGLADCADPNNSCVSIQGVLNLGNYVTNCEYYYTVSIRTLGCLVCKRGFSGIIKAYDIDLRDTPSIGYIDSCNTTVTGCDNSVTYYGIVSHSSNLDNTLFPWHIMFNGCHKCLAATEIPVVYIRGGSNDPYYQIQGLSEYNSADITTKLSVIGTGDGLSTICADVSTGQVINGITITSIAPNCALAFINAMSTLTTSSSYVDGTGTVNLNKSDFSVFCTACKEGYRAVRAKENGFQYSDVVVDCIAIPNCAATTDGTWLNSCQECSSGYSYLFDQSDERIYFDQCSSNNGNQYCLAVKSNQQCVLCKKGYQMNASFICELLTPPLCTKYYNNSPLHYMYEQVIFYLAPKPNSCTECQSGYLPMKQFHSLSAVIVNSQTPSTKKYCVTRDPHTTIVDPGISNCEPTDYANQNSKPNIVLSRNDCLNCITTHIEAVNGRCALIANNPDCVKTTDDTSNWCHLCDTGYVPVKGVCTILVNAYGVIDNCVAYSDATFATGAVCTKCDPGYYVNSSVVAGETVTTCDLYIGSFPNCIQFHSTDLSHIYCTECATGYALLVLEGDVVGGVAGNSRVCIDVTGYSDSGCGTWNLTKQITGQLECLACNTYLKLVYPNSSNSDLRSTCPQIPLLTNCAIYDMDTAQFNSKSYNPADSTLKCTKCDAAFYFDDANYQCLTRTNYPIANCGVYSITQDICQTCETNYILALDSLSCAPTTPINTSPAVVSGSIFACRAMTDCSATYYEGLPSYVGAIASCHVCTDNTKIPFIAVRAGLSYTEITGLNEYGLSVPNVLTDAFDKGSGDKAVQCLQPVNSSFGIAAAKFNFPSNCALGIINTNAVPDATDSNITTGVDRAKISVFCASCSAGYKRTIAQDNTGSTSVSLMAGSCAQITNCSSSTWFNYCSQCGANYGYGYTDATGVKYDECISTSINPDCFAINNTDPLNLVCKFCKKGYQFNLDGYCELLSAPLCNSTDFTFKQAFTPENLATGLYLNMKGIGCQACNTNYSALYQSSDNYICTPSPYHSSNLVTVLSSYIYKCKYYYEDSGLLYCKECDSGYVIVDVTEVCIIDTNLTHCVLALTSSTCKICAAGYVPVNRICEAKNITNCSTYANDENSTQQLCSKCASGYYLDSNACVAGAIANCQDHENATTCNICDSGFTLVTISGGKNYCYPVSNSLNCSAYDATNIASAQLTCTTCASSNFIISTDATLFDPTICLPFVSILNCASYDVQALIANSTFDCNTCNTNFYLSSGSCATRTNLPTNCSTYNNTQDTCSTCNSNYFVQPSGLTCTAYPTGVQNCRTYSDATTCSDCKENTYLSSNKCIDIAVASQISNCKYYQDASTCTECATGYFLDTNACNAVTATDCLTYAATNQCASCNTGFGLDDDGLGNIDCTSNTVANCTVPTSTSPFTCVTCNNNYYPDTGVCTATSSSISNCVAYDTATTCIQCDVGYALSSDQLSCLSSSSAFDAIDPNCYDSYVESTPFCSSCDLGYYLSGASCVQCPINNGCANCNPHDTSKCVMCESGYYHDTSGNCLLNALENADDVEIIDHSNVESSSLMKTLILIVTLLNMFWYK